jgi:membrane protease YdiL (CAAX protease family)
MDILLIVLLFLYSSVPAYVLYLSVRKIWGGNSDSNTWHFYYLKKYLITLSFLPILFLPNVDLHLKPVSMISVALLILTIVLVVVFTPLAKKKNAIQFYFSGSYAAFMEEILFRGVIFGLTKTLWGNNLIAIWISSFAFGIWHLKNFAWLGRKNTIMEFFYTELLYGPIFALLMIWTGDIYLSILAHYLADASLVIIPKKYRIGNFVKEDDIKDIRFENG